MISATPRFSWGNNGEFPMTTETETMKCPHCYGAGQLATRRDPRFGKLVPVFCAKCNGTGRLQMPQGQDAPLR